MPQERVPKPPRKTSFSLISWNKRYYLNKQIVDVDNLAGGSSIIAMACEAKLFRDKAPVLRIQPQAPQCGEDVLRGCL